MPIFLYVCPERGRGASQHVCGPAKAGLEFLLTVPTARLPQQTKNGFAGDTGRSGLNDPALGLLALRVTCAFKPCLCTSSYAPSEFLTGAGWFGPTRPATISAR